MRRSAALVTAAAVVVAAAAAVAGRELMDRPAPDPAAAQVNTGTAPVTRGTVIERVSVAGVLGFDGSYPVTHLGPPGVVTAVAEPGTTVRRGGVLYAVANLPVRLLYGDLPAYRDLALGVSNGPDVRQLERNLAAMGLRPGRVDTRFSGATAAAVRRWQARDGVPARWRTGAVPLGSVVFARDALRVGQVSAVAGTSVGPGATVLASTSTRRVVTARVSTDRQQLVRAGDRVRVTLAGTAPVTGTVVRVGRVATSAGDSAGDSAGGSAGDEASGAGAQPATIAVTVAVRLPAAVRELDQAPAQVDITTAERRDVLLVPVVALLARPGGGYRARLVGGGYVQVEPGLFDGAAGVVEVTGQLAEGQRVEVPAP
jgi:peptidoglycan hydrolase-like protein with peptidoglycan-binding domain